MAGREPAPARPGPARSPAAHTKPAAQEETYAVVKDPTRLCPECNCRLKLDATVCPDCRFNLETGEKAVTEYTKVARFWETGLPLRTRFYIFLGIETLVFPGTILTIYLTGATSAVLTPWFTHTVLLAFLLGTFDRIDLTRNKRGQVQLTKSWRVCFVPVGKKPISLRNYEGVVTGIASSSDIIDWAIFLLLLGAGIVPGILWWRYIMRGDTLYAALSKDHGFPEFMLYRGTDEAKVLDIAETLQDVAGLPHNP